VGSLVGDFIQPPLEEVVVQAVLAATSIFQHLEDVDVDKRN